MMRLVLVVASVGLVIWLLGCGGGGGGGALADTSPPTISNVQVNPQKLRFVGGEVTISAEVSDPSGIAEVWAEVQMPDGKKDKVMMSLNGNVYQGKLTAGANTRNDKQAETYKVWVWAKDAKGNQIPEPGEPQDGISFSVTAPEPPPNPPFSS